jgi:acid phosphatase (class A)
MLLMMKHPWPLHRSFLSLFLLALVSACSSAPKTPIATTPTATAIDPAGLPPWATPYYLTEIPFSLDAVMKPPFADSSEEQKKEFAEILKWQKTRTKEQCEAARNQQIPTLEQSFGAVRGRKDLPDFKKMKPEEFAKLKEFFDRYQRDVAYVSHVAKKHWARKRPFVTNVDIHPCIKQETSFAYPSGHGAYGAAGAEILSEVFPRHATGLRKAGKQIGLNRVIGGVHHSSDIEAGYELGHKTVEALRKNPSFQAELNSLKALFAEATSRPSRP